MKAHLKKLTMASVLTAVIFLATWLMKIPLPYGYAHPGDTVIYLLSLLLPLPYGMAAALSGACLADIASGYAIYAPFTLIIKPVCLAVFYLFKRHKNRFLRYLLPSVIAAAINISLYFAVDLLLYGTAGAILSVTGNALQSIVTIILFNLITVITKKYITYKGAKK